jgi:hypothetical protein
MLPDADRPDNSMGKDGGRSSFHTAFGWDCGITEAERKQVFHGEPFRFAAILQNML